MKPIQSNKLLFLFILVMYSVSLFAQDCYTKARSNGIAAYNKEDYKEALKHFDFALNICDETPADNDIAEWIEKCESKQKDADLLPIFQSIYDNMIYVEGGTFQMGSNDSYTYGGDEKPVHQVTVSSFSISRYEVTQKQWKAVMGLNPSYFKGDNLPVENVSWYDVQEFITKLNRNTGKKYRLPTEAEWEFAARGGNRSNGYKYAGGNDIQGVAWYQNNSSNKTHPVGQKQANELGLCDMSGNVCEWCSDWYGKYPSTAQINPKGPFAGESSHVFRGGDWDDWPDSASSCRVSYRGCFYDPGERTNTLGFRLCL